MSDIARKEAYLTLQRIERDGAFSNLALSKIRRLPERDASFATALVLGVTEQKRALDFLIGRYAARTPEQTVLQLLRLGVYQILRMDKVPDSAACNETVALARELFDERRAGFVNAILRSLCREKSAAERALEKQPAAIRYSVGDGLAALFQSQYPDIWEEILASFGKRQPLRIRANRLKSSPEELAERFQAEADGDMLTVHAPDLQTKAIREAENGEYFIQGYGSQMAVRMLGAKPGDTVFDVCACPGGKSLGAALDMENRGKVRSMDLHANKFSLLHKSAERLGVSIIETVAHDAREADTSLSCKADRVLCDVPCSGLGTIAAKPEIRYKDPASFDGLVDTQKRILEASSTYVRPGGVLLYSTCTLNRVENGEQVRAFLQSHPAFTLEEEHTFLPFEAAGEGFYAAKLRKGDA